MDEDILSQVLGKDARGRSRGVGTVVSKSKVKGCAIAQKRLRHVHGEHDELKMRVESLEGTVRNLAGRLEVLINIVGNIEQGIRASVNSSDGGCATHFNSSEFVAPQFQNSTNVANNQKCTVCRDSTSSNIHGKSVPPTHEKVVLDNILLPKERTSKINRQFAETFAEVSVGGLN